MIIKNYYIKAITVFVILICIVLSFAGCGNVKDADANGTTVVSVWTASAHSKTRYYKIVGDYNNTIGKEKGIEINYEVKEGNLNQMIDLAFASQQAPDLFLAGDVQIYAEQGYIAPLEDLPGGNELIEKYKDKIREGYNTYNSKTYTLPVAITTRALLYNKDMFKAAGLVDENNEPQPPKTWSQLREYAKRLTNAHNGEYGIILPMKWSSWFNSDIGMQLMASVGHNGYDPVKGVYDYTGLKPIMETYMGIKADGSYLPGAESIDNDVARSRFSEGKIGMKFGYSFDVGVLNDQFPAKIDWGVAPMPVINPNEQYLQAANAGSSLRINAKSVKSKDAEKIMEVYKWFISDEVRKGDYIEGFAIPYDDNLIKNVEFTNVKKGWAEFADIQKISTTIPLAMPADLTGVTPLNEIFINEIWNGNRDITEALASYTKMMNDGVEKYMKARSGFNTEMYIIKDWNVKR